MAEWWDGGVLYQIYPRSFADSNADGVGDLRGIIDHLDHLAWLGVDGIWLSPTFPSPNADWGYDVADYFGVDAALGTVADLDELIDEAARRDVRVLLDLVPNHTSIEHPWFVDSHASRRSWHRDWYVWADGHDGDPPNNWLSTFQGPAWDFDPTTGQWYLHNFLREQPDLNWWNEEVRDEFDRIIRHWFDRGVAGFRIDAAHLVVKDRDLRDNPLTDEADHWFTRLIGQRQLYNSCRPEVHDVYRRWRRISETYSPPRLLLGETHVFDVDAMAKFYGEGDELQLAFNFPFVHSDLDATVLRTVVEATMSALPAGAIPAWTVGNHDKSRFPTRWCGGDPQRARAVLVLLLGLPGTAVLYYGDELAMPDTDVPVDRLLDPVSRALTPVINRDAARTPMQWTADRGAGFTGANVEPWLPFGDIAACNVAAQRADPNSPLHLTRDLLALRRELVDLRHGEYRTYADTDGVWAWERGQSVVVAVNLADQNAHVEDLIGTVRIATDRSRDGQPVTGTLTLAPWEAAIIERR